MISNWTDIWIAYENSVEYYVEVWGTISGIFNVFVAWMNKRALISAEDC